MRADGYTADIDISGQHVAVFGPGAGTEITYFINRGALVTAVDDRRYTFVEQFRPIDRLYEGATEERRTIRDWVVEASTEAFRLVVAFNMDKDFFPDLDRAAKEHGTSSFAHQLNRILMPGGKFVTTGDLLPTAQEMLPLGSEWVWPDYERLKRELSLDPLACAEMYQLENIEHSYCLIGTKSQ